MVFAVIILNDHKGISFNKKIKDKIKVKMRLWRICDGDISDKRNERRNYV